MIDYDSLSFADQREIDQKAYSKYYKKCEIKPLTFNKWYGSESHKKEVQVLLRKHKIKKINKKADI